MRWLVEETEIAVLPLKEEVKTQEITAELKP